jgi:hypothetical protein
MFLSFILTEFIQAAGKTAEQKPPDVLKKSSEVGSFVPESPVCVHAEVFGLVWKGRVVQFSSQSELKDFLQDKATYIQRLEGKDQK